ncbi:ANTAR domain-containing response regulator [Pantoea coffeiphila]|uniref:ANTAR domain-containing response regulator n=1 Tax=Pantoea coffeiphila TaxID=1465635 RepID=UPI00196181A4|nr:ANTAR domain-containing protein [Pantoea coffeiphila]MBM7341219.1 AmiR/NasT family two-component response regulator [Pantoea coffeiphila]
MIEQSLLAALSGVRLHLFHPHTQGMRAFCTSLTQLGCHVRHDWPIPASLPPEADLAIIAVDRHQQASIAPLFRHYRGVQTPVLALADCQDGQLFPLLLALEPDAISAREADPFSLIIQIVARLRAAQEQQTLRDRLHKQQQARARQDSLAQAKGVLMQTFGLDESGAYGFMRKEAMNTRSSLEFTAERVLNSLQK